MATYDFTREFLKQDAERKKNEMLFRRGAKEFADKLNSAREKDAEEFFEQARSSIAGHSDKEALKTLCVLACNKLFDVGYREFALLFKQALGRNE